MNVVIFIFLTAVAGKLLMTPFSKMVVPPPYCAYQLNHETEVSQASFNPGNNSLAVLLCNNEVVIYDYENSESSQKQKAGEVEVCSAGGNGFNVKCKIPVCRAGYR